MKRGRPKKPNVRRSRTGKSRGEVEAVHPEVVIVRERVLQEENVPLSWRDDLGKIQPTALDPLASFTLGKLLLRHRANKDDPGGISQEQYDAGQAFARLVHRHAAIRGYKLDVQSPSFIMVSRGLSCAPEPEDEQRVCARFTQCWNALATEGHIHGWGVINAVTWACIENRPVSVFTPEVIGDLRVGLSALGRVL